MRKMIAAVVAGVMMLAGGATVWAPVPAWADSYNKYCEDASNDPENGGDGQLWAAAGCDAAAQRGIGGIAVDLINVVLGVLALVAIIMIVVAGQRFLVASGDASKVKQAKDMVLYSLIGLGVALMAWAIVNFVSRYVLTSAANTGTFWSIWG